MPTRQAPIKEYKLLAPTGEAAPVNTAGPVAVAAAAGTVALIWGVVELANGAMVSAAADDAITKGVLVNV